MALSWWRIPPLRPHLLDEEWCEIVRLPRSIGSWHTRRKLLKALNNDGWTQDKKIKSFQNRILRIVNSSDSLEDLIKNLNFFVGENSSFLGINHMKIIFSSLSNRIKTLRRMWFWLLSNKLLNDYKKFILRCLTILEFSEGEIPIDLFSDVMMQLQYFWDNDIDLCAFNSLFKRVLDMKGVFHQDYIWRIYYWLQWFSSRIPQWLDDFLAQKAIHTKFQDWYYVACVINWLRSRNNISYELIDNLYSYVLDQNIYWKLENYVMALYWLISLAMKWFDVKKISEAIIIKICSNWFTNLDPKDTLALFSLYNLFKYYLLPDLLIPTELKAQYDVVIKSLTVKNSVSEDSFFKILRKVNKWKYSIQRNVYIDWFLLDFYIPELNLNIEIDWFHHSNKIYKNQIRDQYLASKRWVRIIRFTANFDNNISQIRKELKSLLK